MPSRRQKQDVLRTGSSEAVGGRDRIVGGAGPHARTRWVSRSGARTGSTIAGETTRVSGRRQRQTNRRKEAEGEHIRQEGTRDTR